MAFTEEKETVGRLILVKDKFPGSVASLRHASRHLRDEYRVETGKKRMCGDGRFKCLWHETLLSRSVAGEGARFLGDINPDRTPGDTTATSDAAGFPELIEPGR